VHCPVAGLQLLTWHLLLGVGHTTGDTEQKLNGGRTGTTIVVQTPGVTQDPSKGYVQGVPSVTAVPTHCPPEQASPVVHGFPSSHPIPSATGTSMHEPSAWHKPAAHGFPVSHDCCAKLTPASASNTAMPAITTRCQRFVISRRVLKHLPRSSMNFSLHHSVNSVANYTDSHTRRSASSGAGSTRQSASRIMVARRAAS